MVIWRPGCELLEAQPGFYNCQYFGRKREASTPGPWGSPQHAPGWIHRVMHQDLQRIRLQRSLLDTSGKRERPSNLPSFLQERY